MSARQVRIICDRAKAQPSTGGDYHELIGHHRYYGSSAINGAERLAEARRGARPHVLDVNSL